MDWEDYLVQCKADMQSSLLLYDEGYYGNSAYFMQQSIEKITKAFIFKYNLSGMPQMLHHPLMFMEEVIRQMQAVEEKAKKHGLEYESRYAQQHENYINQCKGIMEDLNPKSAKSIRTSIKIALWKNSLGIDLGGDEMKIFVKYPDFKSYYMFDLAGGTSAFTTDRGKSDNFMSDVNNSPDTARLGLFTTVVSYGRMIISAFPHEEYGRYPTDIPTTKGMQTSTTLYKQHKHELKKMIEMVHKAIPSDAAAK